ncbi:hypothetical protein Rsub_00401 [Raphidocelis subcapitata]|uniref:PsbP C-terminal domain-containing protein n=1 Tax=Raphidocelis subcapitata TaxID=307507 RepID=A0A2V0NQ89_9CHLO|nr:hypothetical protein Rsub_00401 [Raphidocelis subcapitata]|eukprot:GBF87690.1 hypothetical protein Rsub_00401 [Raphidocelis subcapitata]
MNCTRSILGQRGGAPAAAGQRRAPCAPRRAFVAPRAAAQPQGSSSGQGSGDQHQPSRRAALLLAAGGAALLPQLPQLLAAGPARAAEAAVAAPEGLKAFSDRTLAYSFFYPATTASGTPLSLVLTRPPEKYSSAPPLSADARQRIVCELFDLRRFVTVSLTVGPVSGALKGRPQEEWTPKEVALTVLIDRSTARLSTGQRTALNDVEEAHREDRGGQAFYVYEHASQGSPTSYDKSQETFRHALAATTVRAGLDGTPYLYTLNLSCPETLWEDLLPRFKQSLEGFRLDATTRDYIPPDKDPWKFF